MDPNASLSAPARHERRVTSVVLAAFGAVIAVLAIASIPGNPVGRMLLKPLRGGWHGWFGTFNGVVLLTVVSLPLAALALVVLVRWRKAAGSAQPWRMSLAEVGLVYGTVPWLWITMLPGSHAGEVPGRVSLIPLRDIVTLLGSGPLMATLQIGGNLLVLAALGFFAPLRFRALASVPRILALAAGCSILIETAQYVLQLDRVSSVDDVLLNTAGAGLAALASRHWWAARR